MGEKVLTSTKCLRGPPIHRVVRTPRSVTPGWRLAIEHSFAGVHQKRAAQKPKTNKQIQAGRDTYLAMRVLTRYVVRCNAEHTNYIWWLFLALLPDY